MSRLRELSKTFLNTFCSNRKSDDEKVENPDEWEYDLEANKEMRVGDIVEEPMRKSLATFFGELGRAFEETELHPSSLEGGSMQLKVIAKFLSSESGELYELPCTVSFKFGGYNPTNKTVN